MFRSYKSIQDENKFNNINGTWNGQSGQRFFTALEKYVVMTNGETELDSWTKKIAVYRDYILMHGYCTYMYSFSKFINESLKCIP